MDHKDKRENQTRRDDSDLVSRRHADLESIKYFSSESAREEQDNRRINREELIAKQKGLKIKIKAMRNLRLLGSDRRDSTRRSSLNIGPDTTDRKGMTFGDLPTSSTALLHRKGVVIKSKEVVSLELSGKKS
jgi:hypothetical protein